MKSKRVQKLSIFWNAHKMRWIFSFLILLFLLSCSENEEIAKNYLSETIEDAQEMYEAPAENLSEDQIEEAQQQEIDTATNNCVGDCSGHHAGYEWALENSINNESDCDGSSNSFIEGCVNYVKGGSGY